MEATNVTFNHPSVETVNFYCTRVYRKTLDLLNKTENVYYRVSVQKGSLETDEYPGTPVK